MKNVLKLVTKTRIVLLIVVTVLCNACDKNDEPRCLGVDCLPPATQTGANAFGFLLDGKPFYANGGVTCFYQLVNEEYYFFCRT